MANEQKPCQDREPGYTPLLVREETKAKLKALRDKLGQQDLLRERRLATAALEVVLADPALVELAVERARQIVVMEVTAAG